MSLKKLLLAALAAAFLLSLAAGTASALRSLETGRAEGETIEMSGSLTLANAFTEPVICSVTLRMTLKRTSAKRAGAQIGLITEGSVAGCRGGEARIRNATLPWVMSYVSFGGTLPSITSMTSSARAKFEVTQGGVTCNYSETANTATVSESRRGSSNFDQVVLAGTRMRSETFLCPDGELRGTMTTHEREGTGLRGIRLI